MTETSVGVLTIGQTPRPDLSTLLPRGVPGLRYEIRGALDGVTPGSVPTPGPDEYPLETRMRDGTSLLVGARFLEPRLQRHLSELDDRVSAHLLLCAGPFPGLVAGAPLVRPFEAAAARLAAEGLRTLEVVVPFSAQAPHASARWESKGHPVRTHALRESPDGTGIAEWLATRCRGRRADAVVFDYVGFPSDVLDEVRLGLGLPVLDLGHVAVEALVDILDLP